MSLLPEEERKDLLAFARSVIESKLDQNISIKTGKTRRDLVARSSQVYLSAPGLGTASG